MATSEFAARVASASSLSRRERKEEQFLFFRKAKKSEEDRSTVAERERQTSGERDGERRNATGPDPGLSRVPRGAKRDGPERTPRRDTARATLARRGPDFVPRAGRGPPRARRCATR